jgi:hypothetical protein
MTHWLTSICRVSHHTATKLDRLEEREKSLLDKTRIADIKDMRKNLHKRLILDAMQVEAVRHWPNLGNIDQRVKHDVVLPQTILNYGEYQSKLQKLAMFAE